MSNVISVTRYFSTANEGFNTTLASAISSGATSVPLTSMATLTDGSVFVGIIEPGTANEQTFTGTVDQADTQISNVKWTRGTNIPHTGGVTVVDYVTGTDWNMLTTGILKSLTQAGALNAAALGQVYPVGSIYINASTNTNPATIFGFGTWVAFGTGRMLVGVDAAQTEFNTLGKTGGQKDLMAHSHNFVLGTADDFNVPWNLQELVQTDNNMGNATKTTDITGTGVNNMNPYITVYMWKRTA